MDAWNLQLLAVGKLSYSPELNYLDTTEIIFYQGTMITHSEQKSGGFLLITSQVPMSPHP